MRDESEMNIIRMAREVGAGEPESLYGRTDYVVMTKHELERFAALVAAAEREECAKMCEDWPSDEEYVYSIGVAIRARGEE